MTIPATLQRTHTVPMQPSSLPQMDSMVVGSHRPLLNELYTLVDLLQTLLFPVGLFEHIENESVVTVLVDGGGY